MIIGIAGPIGAGKDTLAQRLIEAHGFVRVNFADALKDEVLARFPRTLRAILALMKPEYDEGIGRDTFVNLAVRSIKPPGIRELLQEYGTEVRRADAPHYWINKWYETLLQHGYLRDGRPTVTTDVRFSNESHRIKALGGLVVRVERPGHAPTLGAHASETSLLDWPYDHVFINDGTVAALWNQLDNWLASRG